MKEQKNITLLCSSFPPEIGAAPSRMYHLAKMLTQHGYCVSVIAAMPNYPSGKVFTQYRGKFTVAEQMEGINIWRTWLIPTHSSSKTKRLISLLSYAFSLLFVAYGLMRRTNPNIIIVSSPPFVGGFIGTKMAKRLGAKIVLNVSDLWPQSAKDLGFIQEGLLLKYLQHKEQAMYARADAFSVQSLTIAAHIKNLGNTQPMFVYRNLQPYIQQANQSRPVGKRKIVYAGLLGIAQGVFDIINAINFAELGTEIHLYGQGYELEKIKSFIVQNPDKGVFYHGSIPADEIPNRLTQYHAMLVPLSTSIMGAVPSKIFNAFANGLPIIFCGDGEAAQIISETQTGFVSNIQDFDGLKNNIKKFTLLSEESYTQLRNNCLGCHSIEYNKELQDNSFIEFLNKI
jgi:glycosyltransferase involved in cell wall biosynthesis